MKLVIAVYVCFSSVFCLTAQGDDAYKKFIKTTSVAIHKAQKQMISAKKTDANGLLARAVILQSNAMKLYKEKNNSSAVCNSALARKYAAEIIKNNIGSVDNYYLIHDDEKALIKNCADDVELYQTSKNSMKHLSELDKEYMDVKSLNNTNIDF